MAKHLLIKAQPRENKKPNALRRSGFIPATVYGHGLESKSLQVNAKEFSKVPHKAYSHINHLEVDNGEKYDVLIRNVHRDPVRDYFLNIEFYKIKSDEKLKLKVPLNFTGHSPAVTAGGVLIVSFNEVEVQCLPKDIPDAIDIDLSKIQEIGQAIHAGELQVAEGVQILAKKDEVIAHVEIPKTHEVEEAAPVAAPGEVPAEGAAAVPAEGAAAPAPAATSKEAAPGKQTTTPAGGKQAAKPEAGGKAPEAKPPKK